MLIIHETDCHGCGTVYFNGVQDHYTYDDVGDVRQVVELLIGLGFINPEDVRIYDDGTIYEELDNLLEKERNAKEWN